MRLVIASALACTLLAPSLAEAQSFVGACKVRTLCAGVERGGGRMMACLREHRDSLSPSCKIAIADFVLNRGGRGGAEADEGRSRGGADFDGPGPRGPRGGADYDEAPPRGDAEMERPPRGGADYDEGTQRGRFERDDRDTGRGAGALGSNEEDAPARRRPNASGSPDGRGVNDPRDDDDRRGNARPGDDDREPPPR